MSDLKQRVIQEMSRPTARDGQSRIGPSGLGDPCPRCVGRALAAPDATGSDFSLYPWLGTAGHTRMETDTFPDGQHELKLYVGDVEGYGPIKGTTDMYLEGTVVDWKFVGIKKIKTYRLKGAPDQYRYQAMLYGRGCELAGMPVENIAIVFIPRDSGDPQDIFVHEEAYQPEMAQAALDRAGLIYAAVLDSGWESLPSSGECWTCDRTW